LSVVLATRKPSQKVAVVVRHQDGKKETLQVTLGEYPGTKP
jgi:hypothetical protein